MVDGNLLWKSMLWKFILWTFLWEYVEELRVVELNVVGYNRSYKLLINKFRRIIIKTPTLHIFS